MDKEQAIKDAAAAAKGAVNISRVEKTIVSTAKVVSTESKKIVQLVESILEQSINQKYRDEEERAEERPSVGALGKDAGVKSFKAGLWLTALTAGLPLLFSDEVKEFIKNFFMGFFEGAGVKDVEKYMGYFSTAATALQVAVATYFGAKVFKSLLSAFNAVKKLGVAMRAVGLASLLGGDALVSGAEDIKKRNKVLTKREKDIANRRKQLKNRVAALDRKELQLRKDADKLAKSNKATVADREKLKKQMAAIDRERKDIKAERDKYNKEMADRKKAASQGKNLRDEMRNERKKWAKSNVVTRAFKFALKIVPKLLKAIPILGTVLILGEIFIDIMKEFSYWFPPDASDKEREAENQLEKADSLSGQAKALEQYQKLSKEDRDKLGLTSRGNVNKINEYVKSLGLSGRDANAVFSTIRNRESMAKGGLLSSDDPEAIKARELQATEALGDRIKGTSEAAEAAQQKADMLAQEAAAARALENEAAQSLEETGDDGGSYEDGYEAGLEDGEMNGSNTTYEPAGL